MNTGADILSVASGEKPVQIDLDNADIYRLAILFFLAMLLANIIAQRL